MGLSLQSLPPRIVTGGSADQSWQADAGRYRIEFTGNILEELRFEASRAMNGYACLGIGGVLLGRRSADGDVVEAWKPIHCDHSRGPGFLLSARDEAALSAFLEGISVAPAAGSDVAQPEVLGWFISHPKGELEATEAELELHRRHLPVGSLLMIVRPDRLGDAEVQIHVASQDAPGVVDAVEPLLIIEPLPIAKREPGQRRQKKSIEAPSVLAALSGQQHAQQELTVEPEPEPELEVEPEVEREAGKREPDFRVIWGLLAVSAVLLGLGITGFVLLVRPRTPAVKVANLPPDPPMEMLSLHAAHRDGEFTITWNGTSAAVRYARKASLELHQNSKVVVIPLSRKEMVSGEFRYKRHQGGETVLAKLVLQGDGGDSFEETTEIVDGGAAIASMMSVTPDMVPPAARQKN
ncbi:hypothetical protein [Paludibaculum fermentans]|uniref:hypothetical protein n=1 Tax=Paludibaculum fermentans TaxID=1473598 RepID=UPI003EBBD733